MWVIGCTVVSLVLLLISALNKLIHLMTYIFHHHFLFMPCVTAVLRLSALG